MGKKSNNIDLTDIHLGKIVKEQLDQKEIDLSKVCHSLACTPQRLEEILNSKSMDAETLLKFCSLLGDNLFLYFQDFLQINYPDSSRANIKTRGLYFRKMVYSPKVKGFLINQVKWEGKNPSEVINKFHIPKNTFYRWLKMRKEKKTVQSDQLDEDKSLEKIKFSINKVRYKKLFRDMILDSSNLTITQKNKFLKKVEALSNIRSVMRLSKELEPYLERTHVSSKRGSLRAFDKAFILKVLREQKKKSLSNSDIRRKYKLSRNTIAKWKKLFGDTLN
jgi:transposase